MQSFQPKIIDSHVHLDNIYTHHPNRISWMQEHGIMTISWAFALGMKGSERREDLEHYLNTNVSTIQQLHDKGFPCFFLAGIHPRNITADLQPEDIKDLVMPFLDHPLCLGIGEIGLENGTSKEKEIFAAHLDLAESLRKTGKKLGIHTPQNNKPEITQEILAVLSAYPGIGDIAVIDHCKPDTIGWVLERGFHAGVTLSPPKASFQELEQMVSQHAKDVSRIMCNTDSGGMFFEDLWQFAQSDIFDQNIRNQLIFENAFQFFGLGRYCLNQDLQD